ncbi:MAG: signal peptidase I [Chlamydiota bacterium]
MKKLSLSKSKKIFFQQYAHYKRKKNSLSQEKQKEIECLLLALQKSLQLQEKIKSSELAQSLEFLAEKYFPKSSIERSVHFFFSLAIALALAILVRQMWFEFYTIPTGSMRPTLKEMDYLVVSKTPYGLNMPGRLSHFYFDENRVQRGDVVIFSADQMDIRDPNTMYFYIIPGKKQFIKRLIGKPGDTIYFYGGQVYGIDKEGKEFSSNPWINAIEHIPFLRFEGNSNAYYASSLFLKHFNEPIAKLHISPQGLVEGELFPNTTSLVKDTQKISSYDQIFGLENFATARILTEEEYLSFTSEDPLIKAPYYLELRHHPSLNQAHLMQDRGLQPTLGYNFSYIPLDEEHLQKIFSHLTTARFIVKNERAYRLGQKETISSPDLKNVPDGTYEFIDGKGSFVSFLGTTHELKPNHPLFSINKVLLFNLGIEWDTAYLPHKKETLFIPSRYSYFRDENLFLMGAPIFLKNDFILQKYLERERTKSSAFIPLAVPTKELIEKNGLRIPEKMYLVLGDNHAMSSDGRVFGFVPEQNIRGKASFLFWPIGSRFGFIKEPASSIWTLSNGVIWGICIISFVGYFTYQRKRLYRPLKF